MIKCIKCGREYCGTGFVPEIDGYYCSTCWFEHYENKSNSPLSTQVGGEHYKNMKIQPSVFNRANNVPHAEGEVIYHTLRHREKDGVKDIDKAIQWLQIIKELDYNNGGTKK